MNDSGTIVGYAQNNSSQDGFILQGSQFTEYMVNEGSPLTSFNGINDIGQIVGWAGANTGIVRSVDGTVAVLGDGVIPFAINDAGQIVGFRYGNTGFLSSGGVLQDLYGPNSAPLTPRSISNVGSIVGSYQDLSGLQHGFLYTSTGFAAISGPNGLEVNPLGINSNGEIVGTLSDGSGFVLTNGAFSSITTADGSNFSPVAINDSGQILGTYKNESNTLTAIANPVTPVPEPSSITLCISAFVWLAIERRIRN